MADTTFVDDSTIIYASWLNDLNDFYYATFGGTTGGAITAATGRTALGLGTIATQNSNNVTVTGGSVTGITDLAVADGGTGSSTAAAARVALGTIGNLLSKQDFTTNGTWTKPANCKYIIIEAVGAGGGGGGAAGNSTDSAAAGSGASGYYGKSALLDVSAISSGTVVVSNTGGTAGAAAGGTGGTGGNTTWSDGTNSFTWAGGVGGDGATAAAATSIGPPAQGGAVDSNLRGFSVAGAPLYRVAGSGTLSARGGSGAHSGMGKGGSPPGVGAAGSAGTGFGSGGSGGQANSSIGAGGVAGGAGAPGFLRVWEYY